MIIADTSGLLAWFNQNEPAHAPVRELVEQDPGPVVVSPYVVAELDYLVATRVGQAAALTVLRELCGGAYLLPAIDHNDLADVADVVEQYHDLDVGVTDASLIVLADRLGTHRVLTLDHRHFGAMRSRSGAPLQLLLFSA